MYHYYLNGELVAESDIILDFVYDVCKDDEGNVVRTGKDFIEEIENNTVKPVKTETAKKTKKS